MSAMEREFESMEASDLAIKLDIQPFAPFVLHLQALEEFLQP